MNGFNRIVTWLFDVLLSPFSDWPLATLVVISCVSGVLMSLVFKFVSNQNALARVLDQGRGNALAIKLFKDDIQGMFISLANVFWLMVQRIWFSLSPVLVMAIPLLLLLSQLYLRYEHQPLTAAEPAVVTLEIEPAYWEEQRETQLQEGEGFVIETPALHDEIESSISWRVSAVENGFHRLTFENGSQKFHKCIAGTNDIQPLATVSDFRVSKWWDAFWFAGEERLNGELEATSISIIYPKRETPIFGYAIPWWMTFFLLSIFSALISQPFLKVRF